MATSPSNATTQEYTQGVNEIAQNDLNRPTFQTDLNPTPPMDLRQALRNFKNGIYGDMTKDEMVDNILACVYTRVMAKETAERLKDNLCRLWRCRILRDAGEIIINGLMEEVDFETGLLHGEDTIYDGHAWMDVFSGDGSAIDGFACDNADVILKAYGFDEAMEDFYEQFVLDIQCKDLGLFYGLKDFIAYKALRDTVFGFGCVMFDAIQPPTPTLEIAKAPKSVGECLLCCDESSVLLTLPCGHAFGSNCLQEWVDTKHRNEEPTTCPLCRAQFIVVKRVSYVELLDLLD
jgi:hypothetical protein